MHTSVHAAASRYSHSTQKLAIKILFWASTFNYSAETLVESKSVLSSTKTNLSASQKELLLWHQCLSHANVNWIQTLMRDRKWLIDSLMNNLHCIQDLLFIALLKQKCAMQRD
jgi:hypothetical protein